MRRMKLLLPIALSLLLGACVSPPKATKTSLELQSIQAKNFEAPHPVVFKSTMSVLQDLGYIVKSASMDTGFITAESPTQQDQSGGAVFAQIFAGVRTEQHTAVTASIEGMKEKLTRVRLNFVVRQKRSSAYGQSAADDAPIEDSKIYQNAFDKIGEAVFIRTSSK
jgi:environmental stress-induced protein Ves